MGHAAVEIRLTAEQFLAWDATQSLRHEFVAGEVFAMAGAEDRHVTVTLNVAIALRGHLAGTPCKVFVSDMKLHVAAADAYFYPDVMVTCGERDRASPLIKSEASLVVEVLSASTAAYDRGAKFAAYRKLPSLQEFLVIDIDGRRSDLHRKGADGLWVLHPFEPGDAVQLRSVGLDLTVVQLFAEVDARPSGAAPV